MSDMSSDIWNALPINERKRLRGCIIEIHIREVEMAKSEARIAHRRHMDSLNDRLKAMKRSMLEWERETLKVEAQ